MLPEISLNILDIAQNSIKAEASLVEIKVVENSLSHMLYVQILDNGKGMDEEMCQAVQDPFFTSRSTRKVGLGIPFFKDVALATGGDFGIESEVGVGTCVWAEFHTDDINCMPLGDINGTILALITPDQPIDFVYQRKLNGEEFQLDTRQIREIIGDIPFTNPDVYGFLKSYLEEHEAELQKSML